MGMPVTPTRDRIVAEGITINGLPIMLKTSYAFGPYSIPNLDVYYEDCVIGGPGAFMITVDDPARFAIAIRRKLVLEIAGLTPEPRLMKAASVTPEPRVDCLIGEKQSTAGAAGTRSARQAPASRGCARCAVSCRPLILSRNRVAR